MKDVWHKIMKWFDHNRWQTILPTLTLLILVGFVTGCDPSTFGITEKGKGKQVTRPELMQNVAQRVTDLEQETTAIIAEKSPTLKIIITGIKYTKAGKV